MDPKENEMLPAVISVGYPDKKRIFERYIRYRASSDNRKSAQELFFYNEYGTSILFDYQYKKLLELVRLAPSASNNQPWRNIATQNAYHFYLARTPGYYERNKLLLGLYDLQLIDMGIALCHFHYGVVQYGINGVFTTLAHHQIEGIDYIISYEKKY